MTSSTRQKRGLLLACSLLASIAPAMVAQGPARIMGRVIDPTGAPLRGVDIYLTDTSLETITKSDGSYEIAGVNAGRYTVLAVGGSYRAQRTSIVVRPGESVTVDFAFSLAHVVLPGVEVTSQRSSGYTSAYTFGPTKTAATPIETPQAVSLVTRDFMDDVQAFAMPDVMNRVSGVHPNAAVNDVDIRGFRSHTGPSGSGHRLVNGLRSGFGYFNSPLLANIERLEVLKGPGAMLYGNTNPGGTINLVTKKPSVQRRHMTTLTVGTHSTARAAIDLTGPLNTSRSVLYRLNAGYERTDTFRKVNDRGTFLVAPSITVLPTENTTVTAEFVFSKFDGFLDRGSAIPAQDVAGADISLSLSQPSDWYEVEDLYLNVSLNQRLSDDVTLDMAYLGYAWSEDLAEHRTLNRWVNDGVQTVSRLRYWERVDKSRTDNVTANLTLRPTTGAIGHTILLGADWISFSTDGGDLWEARTQRVAVERETTNESGETVTVTETVEKPLTFDLVNPVYRNRSEDIRDNYVLRQIRTAGDRADEYRTLGVYLQDQIELSSRLEALIGLRWEFYRDIRDLSLPNEASAQDQRIFVPRFGLTVGLSDEINVYGNVSHGFVPVSPTFIYQPELYRPDGRAEPFDHETSRQFEVGAKGAFLARRLLTSLALYEIEKANVLQATGEVNALGNEVLEQLGRVTSRGIEVDVVGQIIPSLSISANYSYNPTEIEESDDASERGLPLWGAPKHLARLWTKHVISQGALRNLGVGFGITHASSRRHRFLSTDLQSGKRFYADWPAYTVVDLALSYRLGAIDIAVNVDNLFDKNYWIGGFDYLHAYPGAPFRILTRVGYRF